MSNTKQKWIEALRSGKYKQGFGQLRNDRNEFCCLGVLADIKGEEWSKFPDDDGDYSCRTGCIGYWPIKDKQERITTELVRLNDSRKLPFSEIADWIEENIDSIDIDVE